MPRDREGEGDGHDLVDGEVMASKIYDTAIKYKDKFVKLSSTACSWSPATGWVMGYNELKGVMIEPSDPNAGWDVGIANNSGSCWTTSARPRNKRGYWVAPEHILGLAKEQLSAKEIAERFKGQVLQVRKDYHDPIYDNDKDEKVFEARIIGFKESSDEVMGSPVHDDVDTCWTVASSGYKNHVIVDPVPKYGWWFKADAFIIPTGQSTGKGASPKKDIPPWPHVCPGCRGPALMFSITTIDCKNKCKPQYTWRR